MMIDSAQLHPRFDPILRIVRWSILSGAGLCPEKSTLVSVRYFVGDQI